MSLFAPAATARPAPVVLQVHGGGWERGERFVDLAQSTEAAQLVAHGIVVASVNYRLAPENPWPDQIIDVKCAVRFLRANALELGIDPNRIAVWGSSAGGQLVSLLGANDTPAAWDTGAFGDVSSRVDAVVDEFGPTDLTAPGWGAYIMKIFRTVFGTASGSSPVLRDASPITYVGPGDSPFLILQGTADHIVPAAQSEDLAQRLEADHVPTELDLVARGAHGLGTPGEDPSPGQIDAADRLVPQQGVRHRTKSCVSVRQRSEAEHLRPGGTWTHAVPLFRGTSSDQSLPATRDDLSKRIRGRHAGGLQKLHMNGWHSLYT